jgi:acetyltransferase-like isoleucine patch superfamily enzyme
MSDPAIQAETDKAIDAFKSENFVEMTSSELAKVIGSDPDLFDDTCQFFFLRRTLNAIENGKLKIVFQRRKQSVKTKIANSSIYIGSRAGHINIYCRGRNICLVFGKDTRLGKDSEQSFDIRLSRDSTLLIGEATTCNSAKLHSSSCFIQFGRDCMFSSEIVIQGNDGHGIIDLQQGKVINNHCRSIEIGDHVWLARRVIVLPDVKIGAGSIIGIGSTVAKDVESMSIAVGSPARTIKQGFTWTREILELDEYSSQVVSAYKEK